MVALVEREEREEPLGRERVGGGGGPGREVGLPGAVPVVPREAVLRHDEGPPALVGGEEVRVRGGGGRPARVAVPEQPRRASRDDRAREPGLGGARELPSAGGEEAAQHGGDGLWGQHIRADRLDHRPGEVGEGGGGYRGGPEDAGRVEHERDALLPNRQKPRLERERRTAGEPARDLEEPFARRDPDVLEAERSEPGAGEGGLRRGRLHRDRELDEVGQPVTELARPLPDVEGELHVGDLERQDLVPDARGDRLIGEAHVGPAALEAQLEPGAAPRPAGRRRGGGRVLRLGQDCGILPPGSGGREIRGDLDIGATAAAASRAPRPARPPPAAAGTRPRPAASAAPRPRARTRSRRCSRS